MVVLGIDSSAKTASCGICDGEKMIVDFTLNHKRTHSEKLLEMIDMALKISQLELKDIEAFSVCRGPGSFTGLRIGLSTVKGLCHALNVPCYTCSTLDMLYENVKTEYVTDALIVPVMDARRNEVYTAVYHNDKNIVEDTALPITELIKKIDAYDENIMVVFTGDGVAPNLQVIKEHLGKRAFFAPENLNCGSGYAVIKAGLKENNPASYEKIIPSYLRLSQAERLKSE